MASKLTQNLTEATVLDSANDRVPIFSAASPSELRYMTPANLAPTISDASTTVKGKVELATDAETITGTDTARAITPSNLTAKMDTDGTLAGNSDTRIPSQKAVKTYADRALNTLLTRIPLYAPQGFLINGKISVTDSGSGLVVALKTLAGTDPSATDPIYVRLNDTVRTISQAISVTCADGTNWFNAGSAELATKEIDYFVYLIWNSANSRVSIAFSRVPHYKAWSEVTDSNTSEKNFEYDSNFGSAVANDECEVIGRFAATLSAGAGYTWSVPTYTAINLIQRPIYETRVLTWLPTWAGWTNNTSTMNYKVVGNQMIIYPWGGGGTSNSATTTGTLPFIYAGTSCVFPIGVIDNSAWQAAVGRLYLGNGSATIQYGKAITADNGFTASGTKTLYSQSLSLQI